MVMRSRGRLVAGATVVVAGSVVVLGAALLALRVGWSGFRRPGPATLDQLAAATGTTALALVCGWLAAGALISAAGQVAAELRRGAATGRAARAAMAMSSVGSRVTPRAVRRLVGCLLGAGIALGAAGPALAVQPDRPPAVTASISPAPVVPAGVGATHAGSAQAAPDRADLDPGWQVANRQQPRASASHPGPGTASSPSASTPGMATLPGARPVDPPPHEVVVHRGDTLWALAARTLGPAAGIAEIAAEWPRWYAANRAVIGEDPDRLLPGMRLRPPGAPATTTGGGSR